MTLGAARSRLAGSLAPLAHSLTHSWKKWNKLSMRFGTFLVSLKHFTVEATFIHIVYAALCCIKHWSAASCPRTLRTGGARILTTGSLVCGRPALTSESQQSSAETSLKILKIWQGPQIPPDEMLVQNCSWFTRFSGIVLVKLQRGRHSGAVLTHSKTFPGLNPCLAGVLVSVGQPGLDIIQTLPFTYEEDKQEIVPLRRVHNNRSMRGAFRLRGGVWVQEAGRDVQVPLWSSVHVWK